MIPSVLAVLAGLGLLTWASEHFVIGASRLSFALRLSPVLIGAAVTGGARDIALGNVIGSNAANATLVLGTAAAIVPATIATRTLRREVPLSTLSVLLLAGLLVGGVSRRDGILCLLALVVFLVLIVHGSQRDEEPLAHEVAELVGELPDASGVLPVHPVRTESLRTVAGLVGTLVGAQALIWGALDIADRAGLSQGFVGFTLVAVGTSLPELVTAIQAARKRETDLIVGNVLGSNVFNSLAVAGAVAVVSPGPLMDEGLAGVGVVSMMVVCVLAALFMATGRCIRRWEAGVLLAMYAVSVPLMAV
jgi:cation:H+ antiporter